MTTERSLDDVALFRALPQVGRQVPWVRLGDWPRRSPASISPATSGPREDLTSPRHGGNKVRTSRPCSAAPVPPAPPYVGHRRLRLQPRGRHRAPRRHRWLRRRAPILFPQPASEPALANASALLGPRPR
jgi:hypothetical protein